MPVSLVGPDQDAQEESDNNRDRPQDAVPTVLEANIDDADGDDRHTQERAHKPPSLSLGPTRCQRDYRGILPSPQPPQSRHPFDSGRWPQDNAPRAGRTLVSPAPSEEETCGHDVPSAYTRRLSWPMPPTPTSYSRGSTVG